MHEPLNLEKLKAEAFADEARVDLKAVITLNLNLVRDKPITSIVHAEASVLCVRS
jgi:hypothetical protein